MINTNVETWHDEGEKMSEIKKSVIKSYSRFSCRSRVFLTAGKNILKIQIIFVLTVYTIYFLSI